MTKQQMIDWLQQRYVDESAKYPTLARNVSMTQYIQANLPHMLRSWYWKARDASSTAHR